MPGKKKHSHQSVTNVKYIFDSNIHLYHICIDFFYTNNLGYHYSIINIFGILNVKVMMTINVKGSQTCCSSTTVELVASSWPVLIGPSQRFIPDICHK